MENPLRALREERGFDTTEAFSQALNYELSRSYLSQLERGKVPLEHMTVRAVLLIAGKLGVDPELLFHRLFMRGSRVRGCTSEEQEGV